jgi:hypothetical protein
MKNAHVAVRTHVCTSCCTCKLRCITALLRTPGKLLRNSFAALVHRARSQPRQARCCTGCRCTHTSINDVDARFLHYALYSHTLGQHAAAWLAAF